MTGQVKLDWLIQTGQNLFGPKMHLRMKFDLLVLFFEKTDPTDLPM